jgi:hypothetical protein
VPLPQWNLDAASGRGNRDSAPCLVSHAADPKRKLRTALEEHRPVCRTGCRRHLADCRLLGPPDQRECRPFRELRGVGRLHSDNPVTGMRRNSSDDHVDERLNGANVESSGHLLEVATYPCHRGRELLGRPLGISVGEQPSELGFLEPAVGIEPTT